MALTFSAGTAGSVRDGAATVAGLTKWSIDKQLAMIASPHFGITADGNGVKWNLFTLKGLAQATVDLEGWYDVGDNSETALYVGKSVTLDLFLNLATLFGYENLSGTVMSVSSATDITANNPNTFRARVQLTGTVVPTTTLAS